MQVALSILPRISYVLLSIADSCVKTSQPFTLVNSTSFIAALRPSQQQVHNGFGYQSISSASGICATNVFDKSAKDIEDEIRPWMKKGYILTATGEQETGKGWMLLANDRTSQVSTLHLSKWSSQYSLQSELRLDMSKECAEAISNGVHQIAGIDMVNLLDRTIIKDKLQSHSVVGIQAIGTTTNYSYGRNAYANPMGQMTESHLWMILRKDPSVWTPVKPR